MIGALIALLSLDVTRKLVAASIVYKTLTVVGATNATPVVLQTSAPHGIIRPSHGVVSGINGNDGANGVWVLTPTDSTHLSLSSFTQMGVPYSAEGTGSYTSGGTVQIAFPDGSILLGRRNIAMQTMTATPRIVFVPVGSQKWEIEPYGALIPPATRPNTRSAQTDEQQYMHLNRQLNTEKQRFEIHVTGCANPPSPDFGDFDVTQALYHTLYASMFNLISPARAQILSGHWVSQDETIQTVDSRGQKWVGIVEISQPVTDNPFSFVPASTDGIITVNFVNGSSGEDIVIVLPEVQP